MKSTWFDWSNQVGYKLEIDHIFFESDSKLTVDNFNKPNRDMSELGYIIDDSWLYMFDLSPFFVKTLVVEYVRRQTNVVTYKLARVATYSQVSKLWFYPILYLAW